MIGYLKFQDSKYIADMEDAVDAIMDVHREQDKKADGRLAQLGITNKASRNNRKKLCHIAKYYAMRFQVRRIQIGTIDVQRRIRRRGRYLMKFGE